MDKKGTRKKNWAAQLYVAIGVAVLAVIITRDIFFSIGPLNDLKLKFIDERFDRRGEITLDSSDVVIVEMTQASYDQIPPPYRAAPWPRNLYARLIENLNEAGAKAIGIDVVMSNTDRLDPKNDQKLINAIRRYGNVVVAGKVNEVREAMLEGTFSDYSSSVAIVKKSVEDYSSLFYQADSSIGIVQVISDKDGVHRRYTPFVYSASSDSRVPSFSFAVLNKYLGLPANTTAEIKPNYFELGPYRIPKYDNTTMLVNFYGISNLQTFKHINFVDVIDDKDFNTVDEIDLEEEINTWDDPDFGLKYSGIFKDKVVLVGSTMPEDRDVISVAISRGKRAGDNQMYGVELHATALQNIIINDFIRVQSKNWEIILTIVITFFGFFISSWIKSIKSKYGVLLEIANLLLILGIMYGFYEFSMQLFIHSKLILTIVPQAVALTLGYFGSTAYNFVVERYQSTEIKRMFTHYVSGELVNELINHPDKLKLGGDRKELTIFFSDIAGFSTFSEKMEPEELVGLMNEYLTEMTNIVFQNKGTLDKYVGDAIMSFWGAPVFYEDHAHKACISSITMLEKLDDLRKRWNERGLPSIDIRIGVNTGDVIVGNVGSASRFDFTVMGDTVNLASRLEGVNKQYGTRAIISETTYEHVIGSFLARELDKITVKGKKVPTKIFELIGEKGNESAEKKIAYLQPFLQGLALYKEKRFEDALPFFESLISEEESDPPSIVYAKRCKFYMENPPEPDWDGVFEMKTK